MRAALGINAIIFSLSYPLCAPYRLRQLCCYGMDTSPVANAQEQSEHIEYMSAWKVHSLWEALITLMPMRSTRMQHFKDVALRGLQYAIAFLLEVYAQKQTLLWHKVFL
jgi:hypothetical protein